MIDWVTNFDSHDEKREFYEMLKGLDGEWCICLERKRKKRSKNQNAYYWRIINTYIVPFIGGCSDMEVHIFLKDLFLPHVQLNEFGMWSTRALDTMQFEEYLDLIRTTFLLTFNIEIPLPNQMTSNPPTHATTTR